LSLFYCMYPAPPEIYTLSLHDALPISHRGDLLQPKRKVQVAVGEIGDPGAGARRGVRVAVADQPGEGERVALEARHVLPLRTPRSEEHTSELQSRSDLVCRLLLEKKNK